MLFQYDLDQHKSPAFWGSKKVTKGGSHIIKMMAQGEDKDDHSGYESLSRFPPGELVSEYEIYGVEHELDLPSNPHRDKTLAFLNSRSRNVARLNDIGPWIDIAALHMSCYGADIPEGIVKRANFLFPIIGKAVETSRIIRNLSSHYGAILQIFDRLSVSAAICNHDLEVAISNRHFDERASERNWFSLMGSRLSVADVSAQTKLLNAIKAGHQTNSPANANIISMPCRDNSLPFLVKCISISDPDLGTDQSHLSLLLMIDPQEQSHIDVSGIAAFELLSPAELEVCSYLVQGFSTDKIAEMRDTSLTTARNQIKSVIAKLGCSTRLDVTRVALVTTSPIKSGEE